MKLQCAVFGYSSINYCSRREENVAVMSQRVMFDKMEIKNVSKTHRYEGSKGETSKKAFI